MKVILSALVCLALVAGCGAAPKADPTATPRPLEPVITDTTGGPESSPTPGSALPINPTPTPNLSSGNPVQVTELKYFQLDNQLTVAAKLHNQLSDAIIRNLRVEILAKDANGNRLEQIIEEIRYLFEEETTGIVRVLDLQAGATAESIEVRVTGGLVERSLKVTQPFELTHATFFAGLPTPIMTAWLNNRDAATYTNVSVNAIAYNALGEIVGAGNSVAAFAPGEDRIGVSTPSAFIDEPARVEFYAWLGNRSAALQPGSWWDTIAVRDWNYVITPQNFISGGAILENKTKETLSDNFFIVTVFDELGQVCLVHQGMLDALWPEEQAVYSPGELYAPTDSSPKYVDFIVVPGEFRTHQLAFNPLNASQAAVLLNEDNTLAQVSVVNNLNAAISPVLVSIIAKDAQGRIVGGASGAIPTIGAYASETAQFPLTLIGPVEAITLEASATIPGWAIIGN